MAEASAVPLKLELRNVSIRYPDPKGPGVQAVQQVSLSVANKPNVGELAVFLGPSGCGKSTLLRAVAGLLTPDSGEILVDGKPIASTGRDRGMVFQSYTSFGWLTVRENVEYGLRLQGVGRKERQATAEGLLKHVGLSEFSSSLPRQLSGGMKQRLAIARTLANRPNLILMDEPFGALDPRTRWGMQTLILDVLRQQDNTVLFVTHDIEEAVLLADVIFILSDRPARVLHRVEVPYFAERDVSLKQTPAFKQVTDQVLDLLRSLDVRGNVRVGL